MTDAMAVLLVAQLRVKACSKAYSGSVRISRAQDNEAGLGAYTANSSWTSFRIPQDTRQFSISLLYFPFCQQ